MPNPYVNKVVQSNGTTLIDISDTTAVAADVASGKHFYLATGEKVAGSGSGGGGSATLITKTITENGTYSAEDDDADGYSEVTVNVPSSAASSWTKIAETSYQVSTTQTSAATVATWATGHSELWTSDKIVYVRIRDTAGPRDGYFYGSDSFYLNIIPKNNSTQSNTTNGLVKIIYKYADGKYTCYQYLTTSGYGVFTHDLYSNGRITIRCRYHATYTTTIDGTYKVEVYLLDPPTGAPIFT